MDVKLLSGALGAEISGIDLKDITLENFKKINKFLLEHKVIFLETKILLRENSWRLLNISVLLKNMFM